MIAPENGGSGARTRMISHFSLARSRPSFHRQRLRPDAWRTISANCNYNVGASGAERGGAKRVANARASSRSKRMDGLMNRYHDNRIASKPNVVVISSASGRPHAGHEAAFNYRTLRDNVPSVCLSVCLSLSLSLSLSVGVWDERQSGRARVRRHTAVS